MKLYCLLVYSCFVSLAHDNDGDEEMRMFARIILNNKQMCAIRPLCTYSTTYITTILVDQLWRI